MTLVDIKQCRSILCQMDRDKWKTKITNSPKLRPHLKKIHIWNHTYIKHKQDRSLLSKLRIGILSLKVEIGQNIKFEDWVCQICRTSVEDESHLVLIAVGEIKKDIILKITCPVDKETGGHSHAQKKIGNVMEKTKYSDFYKFPGKHSV